jgi:hypothetical protein
MKLRYATSMLASALLLSVLAVGAAHAQSTATLGTIEQLLGMGTSVVNQGQALQQRQQMMRQQNAIQQQQAGQNQICPIGERVSAVRINTDGSRTVLCEPIR